MKRYTTAFLVIGLLLAGGIVAGKVWAGFGHGGPMEGLMALELNATQKSAVSDILDASRDKSEPWRESMEAGREAMVELVEGQAFDEVEARRIAQDMSVAMEEMAVIKARAIFDIAALLTPEQRDKARAMFDQAKEMRGYHMMARKQAMKSWLLDSE